MITVIARLVLATLICAVIGMGALVYVAYRICLWLF